MQDFNINGLTKDQQARSMNFMLTNEERLAVLSARGTRMTGFPIQKRPGMDSKVYFWSEGLQPDVDFIEQIADKDPIRAAEKFLAIYFPFYESKSQYPQARPKAPHPEPELKEKGTIPEKVIELSLCRFDEFLPEPGKVYKFIKHEGCPHCTQTSMIMELARRAQS